MFRKDRMGRRGGGVLLYVKDTMPAYEIQLRAEADCEEAIWCKLVLLLGAYPRQDVAAQMSLRNCFRSSATLLAAVIVPNVSVMSFSHLCLGFPRLLFPATIPCIIVFSKPLCRVTWPKYLSFCRLTKLYIQFVGR